MNQFSLLCQHHCRWSGWKSHHIFCTASETERDVSQQYMETPVGLLPNNKCISHAMCRDEFRELLMTCNTTNFSSVIEAYVDDFFELTIPGLQEQLQHTANPIMNGIHDVFFQDMEDGKDPIGLSKLLKGDGTGLLMKDILGFTSGGIKITYGLKCHNTRLHSRFCTNDSMLAGKQKPVPFSVN